jgi:hypothetical protein
MRTTTWILSAALVFVHDAHSQAVQPDAAATLNTVLPQAVEITLALSAAPAHLREGATVYVYGAKGYEKVRDGTNGFTCLLNRDGFLHNLKLFSPTCWDKHGEDTHVPVELRVGALLSQKATVEEVGRDIDAGFASGKFHAPQTGGIAYMLAGAVELDLATGQVVKQVVPPHYMFYSVGVTNSQLGFTPEAAKTDPTLPFAVRGTSETGADHGLGYIIEMPGDAHHMHGDAK